MLFSSFVRRVDPVGVGVAVCGVLVDVVFVVIGLFVDAILPISVLNVLFIYRLASWKVIELLRSGRL